METPEARDIVFDLFEAEPPVVERERFRTKSSSVRVQDSDRMRNGVECAPKLFVGGDAVMAPCDRLPDLLTEEDVLAPDLLVKTGVLQRDGGLRREHRDKRDTGRREDVRAA